MLDNKKTYYSISEVCTKTGLEPHVLRYWESEFAQLRPKKNRAGNRAYRDKDIEVIRYIKYLLYEEQYTIPGAKKKLSESKEFEIPNQLQLPLSGQPQQAQVSNGHLLQEVSLELRSLLQILKK
jgi:DNA-binding transcriptional MerR regulator